MAYYKVYDQEEYKRPLTEGLGARALELKSTFEAAKLSANNRKTKQPKKDFVIVKCESTRHNPLALHLIGLKRVSLYLGVISLTPFYKSTRLGVL